MKDGKDKASRRRRDTKQTKTQVDQKLQEIRLQLEEHQGQKAILLQKEGRDMVSYLVTLTPSKWKGGVIATHKCYNRDGGFRCLVSHSIDTVKLLTGEQRIIYFNESI